MVSRHENCAVKDGHVEVAKLLVECPDRDIDVALPDNEGSIPLSIAAMNCHEQVVELMMASGRKDIFLNLPNYDGQTPILLAAA